MVRFNEDRSKASIYNIDVKDDADMLFPKEPILPPQPSNNELEKFSTLVIKVLGDENITLTSTNFQIYFDKLRENKPTPFKKRINEFLALTLEALPQTGKKLTPYVVCAIPELEAEEE